MVKRRKVSELQAYLTVLFVAALLTSNIVAAKQIMLPFGITMTAAVVVFPITYILSDLFSEVYGYRWSRITCYLAFAANALMALIFKLAIALRPAGHWALQEAFEAVLGNTPRMLAASLGAFVVGDLVNDIVFQRMKAGKKDMQGFAGRAIVSSLLGEAIDSMAFIPAGFLGMLPLKDMLIMAATQVLIKTAYEAIIIPLTTYATRKVGDYERANE